MILLPKHWKTRWLYYGNDGDGEGNENDWRRSLYLQCLYKCAYLKALLLLGLPGCTVHVYMHFLTATLWGTCGKYNLWLHCVTVKLQHTSMRRMDRALQTFETFLPQMWQMVWQHKLTWEHPFAFSLALLHPASNVLHWAYRDANWQCRLLLPHCFPPPHFRLVHLTWNCLLS